MKFLASSINPADVKIRTGAVVPRAGSYPYTLGYDLVGEVVEKADDVVGLVQGDLVVAMSTVAITGRGTWAERVCLPATSVALLDAHVEPGAAARLPLVGLTALQAVRRAAAAPGESVLVAGAVGSIGRMVVQLLSYAGVEVHALVRRPEQMAMLPSLGNLIPHSVLPGPGAVDVVIDAAGGDFSASLRDGGRYIALVPDQIPPRKMLEARSIKRTVLVTQESGADLAELVAFLGSGVLTLEDPRPFSIQNIHEAHKEFELNGQRNVVLTPDF